MMRSIIKPVDLIARASEMGMKSVAITDSFTFGGVWDAYKASKKKNIKLIVGGQFSFLDDRKPIFDFNSHTTKVKPKILPKTLVLLAKNKIGYKNILSLNINSFDCRFNKTPLIDWELLEKHSEGVVCLTGDATGILAQSIALRNYDKAITDAKRLKDIFGEEDLIAEIEPNNLQIGFCDQILTNMKMLDLAKQLDITPIVTSNARYLKKEQFKILDMLMAISSGRSFKSRSRPKFEYPQLYLHSRQDIVDFFKRNYCEQLGETLCDNTIDLATRFEKPEWIKPEVVTGEKVQLPTFDVKGEECYDDYCKWESSVSEEVRVLDDDKKYMRYWCEQNWDELVPKNKEAEYKERYGKELEVYEKLGFSSYMLITADFLRWARENDVAIGPGRGCLQYDTLILTRNGFKKLGEIKKGEKVYTHTGNLKKVLNTFEFDIKNEELIKLRIENSFGDIVLTKDHKIYGSKRKTTYKYNGKNRIYNKLKFKDPCWIKACDLENGDFIYTTFPSNTNNDYNITFDLSKFANKNDIINNKIVIKNKKVNSFSIREISRKTSLTFEQVRRIKNGNLNNQKHINTISEYLNEFKCSFDDWLKMSKWNLSYVNRYIKLDDEFLYMLGYWVGDGSLRYKQKNGINYAFNINEKENIRRIKLFYSKLGFNVCEAKNNKNGYSLDIGTTILSNLFKFIFPKYENSSKTKHLPIFFRKLSNRQLKIVVKGLCDSDGSIKTKKADTIKTISKKLVLELKECFDYLKIPSGVYTSKADNKYRNNSESYLIRFSGVRTKLETRRIHNNGYYSLIRKPRKCKINKVYDITVEEDNSYLTSSGVVHNSVGGSLVGYLLGIHKADPIKYGLIFERFLNEEKKELPDIDSDMDSEGREKVLEYVANKYGKNFVAHVSNFITFTPKVAITDVMTALEIGGSRKDAFKIAKNITETFPPDAKNVNDAIKGSKLFAEFVKEKPEIKEYAEQLIGIIRSWATHAAGVVVGKYDLHGLVPLRLDDNGVLALEWEKNRTEENGLIKIDFLGLETLNIIKVTRNIIKSLGKELPQNPPNFEEEHKEVYDLVTNGDTFGVFQLGASGGTIGLCNTTKPKNIEDLAVINALARPGVPTDIKKSYIERKFGRERIEIPHKNLARAVKATMGYCIFEESFLWLAHDLCGWDLQASDKMRKISKMKAKGKHLLEELHDGFIRDSMANSNVTEEFSKRIWDEWVIPLSGYAFNKSHSVLYSMTSFHTAYLKAHYFNEFMTANLISETNSNAPKAKENILKVKHALRKKGIRIVPPDINKSFANYRLIDDKTLITGLSSLHSVKEPAARSIMENRPFSSFEDFLDRTDSSKVRSPTVQALAACGAMDCFGHSRKSMYLHCSDLRKKYTIWKNRNPDKKFEYELPKEEWNISELRALESHYIGEALSGTKKDSFDKLFSEHHAVSNLSDLEKMPNRTNVVVEVEIKDLFFFKVKKETSKIYGQECCRMLLEDLHDNQLSAVMFPDALSTLRMLFSSQFPNNKLEKGFGMRLSGTVNRYNNEISVIASDIYGLFMPVGIPAKMEQKKIIVSSIASKKVKEITSEDIENDMMSIIC